MVGKKLITPRLKLINRLRLAVRVVRVRDSIALAFLHAFYPIESRDRIERERQRQLTILERPQRSRSRVLERGTKKGGGEDQGRAHLMRNYDS